MDRKEKIFSYIESKDYIPLNFSELSIMLGVPKENEEEFFCVLQELLAEGKIFLTKKQRYAPARKNNLYSGKISVNARTGSGFLTTEGFTEDLFIRRENLKTALDGDTVLVKLLKNYKGRREAAVEKILERANTMLAAVITGDFYAICDNPKITSKIKLTELMNAKNGDRVLVEITDFAKNGSLFGAVTKILGSSRDIKTLTEALLFEYHIKTEFDEETLLNARSFPEEVSDSDLVGRHDYTNDIIFTIDGEDARDFDDAVSIKTLQNGNFLLGVHIADVTHYVTENSALDNESYLRGTSVYLPDRVIPMLPFELSNNLASLIPHKKRLTLSLTMEVTPKGEVINHELCKGVIQSVERMTYTDVAKILEGDDTLSEKYEHIVPSIYQMHRLYKILQTKRKNRGSIDFDFPESKIILADNGLPKDIVRLERNDAHRIIEEFMLLANETIAELALWSDIPFIYRVHEEPDSDKMTSLRRFIASFGLYVKGKDIYPKDLRLILDQIKGTENEALIAAYMLRSLMKAEYKNENLGHFGLASKYYCHFTSPIRRYPDLFIHRVLKDFIDGKNTEKYRSKTFDAADNSSKTERKAELLERDCDDLYKAAYISSFVGAEFDARISSVTSFGIFCELRNTVEGLIRLETMHDDYYIYDESKRLIVGERKGKVYKVGDTVNIEVVGADLVSRKVDFILTKQKKKVKNTKEDKT